MADRITMGIQLPPELYEDLIAAADRAGVPKSTIIRWAIADYCEFILKGGEIIDEKGREASSRSDPV